MTAEQLSRIQSPLKENYKLNPACAQAKLVATTTLGTDITCINRIGNAVIETGLHPGVGGSSRNICPATIFLDSLAACAGITMGAVATHMGIVIHSGTIYVEGDLDLRGTLGVSDDVQVGFREIRIHVELDTEVSAKEIETLLKMTEKYCVVYQTLVKSPRISMERGTKSS
jgi:uncharacterized OsmC-like protein